MRNFALSNRLRQGGTEFSPKAAVLGAFILLGLAFTPGCGGDTAGSNVGPTKQSLPGANSSDNRAPMGVGSSGNTNTYGAGELRPGKTESFWQDAAEGGLAEVEMGRLAIAKAQSGDVKKFGEQMVTDHGKANTELKTLAGTQNITLLEALSPDHQSLMSRLQALSGAAFDQAYVDAMAAAHEKDVALFKNEAEKGTNADLKAFAAKTLPTLEQHLQMINEIKSKMAPQQK